MQSLNFDVLLHLMSDNSYNAKPWTGRTCTFAVLLFILITDQQEYKWPEGMKSTCQRKRSELLPSCTQEVFQRRFYPRVQMTFGQVCSEFNTNPHGPVCIPRTLRFESHIKHLIFDFYRFRINENLSHTNTQQTHISTFMFSYRALWHNYVT
jgi:hypothetical protein